MQITQLSPISPPGAEQTSAVDRLEQAFLEEMLKYCGPKTGDGPFSGGAGEAQFTSFLTREHAAVLAGRLDLGFADALGEDAQ